jgi:hypothetical protein
VQAVVHKKAQNINSKSALQKNSELRWESPAGNKISKSRTILAKLQESISNK